jgi:hypothetical protein
MTADLFIRTIERAAKYRITHIDTIERIALLQMTQGIGTLPMADIDETFQEREAYREGCRTGASRALLYPDAKAPQEEAHAHYFQPGLLLRACAFAAIGPPARTTGMILCESAIDAISCFVLYPDCRCISTAGARPDPGWLADLITTGIPIFCGFDSDPTADTMAEQMIARHPALQRLRPSPHDWNDSLRSPR